MRRLSAAVAFAASALAIHGCLEPLPEATSCEEPARVIDGVCVPCDPPQRFVGDSCVLCPAEPQLPFERCVPTAFTEYGVPPNGCLAGDGRYARFDCVSGHDEAACACDEAQVPSTEPTCYSDGVCPTAVEKIDAAAQCFPIAEGEVSWYGAVPNEGCGCGCPSRMARCDGSSFTIGSYSDGTLPLGTVDPVRVDLGERLPLQGKLGVYLLVRGFASPLIVAAVKGDETLYAWAFYVTTDSVQQIGYGPDQEGLEITFLATEPYAWDDESGRPDTLVITPQQGIEEEVILTAVEIDCVLPFVIP